MRHRFRHPVWFGWPRTVPKIPAVEQPPSRVSVEGVRSGQSVKDDRSEHLLIKSNIPVQHIRKDVPEFDGNVTATVLTIAAAVPEVSRVSLGSLIRSLRWSLISC